MSIKYDDATLYHLVKKKFTHSLYLISYCRSRWR